MVRFVGAGAPRFLLRVRRQPILGTGGRRSLGHRGGCLDTPTGLKTERHVFVHDAADYYEITDNLPRDDGSHHSG